MALLRRIFRNSKSGLRSVTSRMRPWTVRQKSRLLLQGLEERMAPAVLTVTSNVDDGVTAGSLRVILATANTNAQADTINFSGSMTINLSTTGQLPISEASQGLVIDGGANSVVINGNATGSATNRLFTITSTGSPTITFKNLTLASGNVSGANAGGAVLFTNQNLSFSSVTFSGNKTAGAGGAIASATASPTISFDSCSFTNNSATGTGGAISLTGVGTNKLTLTNSTFTTNTSASTGGAVQSSSTTTFSAFTGNTFTVSNLGMMDIDEFTAIINPPDSCTFRPKSATA